MSTARPKVDRIYYAVHEDAVTVTEFEDFRRCLAVDRVRRPAFITMLAR